MALFQPSNITPSAWAGEGQGVVNADSNISISWQVNGTSALRSFSIAIYPNTGDAETDSVLVANLVGTVDASVYPNGFYPTDTNGDPQYYTYEPGISWASVGIVDGNSYKYKITQYSSEQQGGVEQNGFSTFITRTVASLFVRKDGEDSARVILTGEYYQAQGDAIVACRWVIYEGNNQIVDTGIIYTSQLQYILDGAKDGSVYTVQLTVITSSGMSRTVQYIPFEVNYAIEEIENESSFSSVNGGIKVTFQNNSQTDIPLTDSSDYILKNSSLSLPTSDSYVEWNGITESENEQGEISWKAKIDSVVNRKWDNSYFGIAGQALFSPPMISFSDDNKYVADIFSEVVTPTTIKRIARIGILSSNGAVAVVSEIERDLPYGVKFCPVTTNGNNWLFLMCNSGVKIFKIDSNSQITYMGLLGEDKGYDGYGKISDIDFSLDGANIAIVGGFSGRAHFYSFDTSTGEATFISNFIYNDENLPSIGCVSFNPKTNLIMLSRAGSGTKPGVYFYTYSNSQLVFYGTDVSIAGINIANGIVSRFSYDGKYAIAIRTGTATGILYRFYVNFNGSSFSSITFDTTVRDIYLGVNGSDVVFCGENGYFFVARRLYEISQSEINEIGEIDKDALIYNKNYNSVILLSAVSTDNAISDGGWYEIDATSVYTFVSLYKSGDNAPSFRIGRNGLDLYVYINGTSYNFPLYANSYVKITPTSITANGSTQEIEQTDFRFVKAVLLGIQEVTEFHSTIGSFFFLNFGDETLNAGSMNVNTQFANAIYLSQKEMAVAVLPSIYLTFIDYGSRSGEERSYNIFFRLPNGNFVSEMQTGNVCQKFNAFYLFETTQDENVKSIYHVQKMWKFGNNAESGSISNNNAPNWLTNFTKYRLKQSVRRMGRTGTLSALISNAVNGVYNDTAQQMDELFAASQSQNTFFLKDPKGNLYMVAISAPIQSQIRLGSTKLETTVSIPWEEVGDATNASLVAYPNDGGWQE